MKAILSDIHGNLEALQAVLEDAGRHNVEAVYCLGDLLGYGPNPRECLELAMGWAVVIRGNFDQAALHGAENFGLYASRSVDWTRHQLQVPVDAHHGAARYLDFLAGLPLSYQEGDLQFVHGTPRNPLQEYLFPEDVYNQQKMERILDSVEQYCFHGHTHIPGICTRSGRFHSPAELGNVYWLEGRKTLINVGSVGQPRDGDRRACYVLLDDQGVQFRRVEYDVDATVRKIYATEGLDHFLGDRLRDGR